MDITRYTDPLEQFRDSLYQNFTNQADTLMELVDAMCSTPEANSVAEYSLSPYFRRSYAMLYKAIEGMELEPLWLAHQLNPYLPRPKAWPFWLLMVDVTPNPRPYAHTLEDRGMVYQPEVVKGKLPVTIGHQYSTVALGLEPEVGIAASWVLPLMTERAPRAPATDQDKELVGMEQIEMLLKDEQLPFGQELTVEVADSSYSKPESLYAHRKYPNVVTIARSRGNRTYYRKYVPSEEAQAEPAKGHPTWYGERFSLADTETWHAPDETLTFPETSRRGKVYTVAVQAWHNLLMTGKTKPEKRPMHECPFTLVRIVRYDQEGKPAFKKPLWLIVMGDRREELTLAHIYEAYAARFDIEHSGALSGRGLANKSCLGLPFRPRKLSERRTGFNSCTLLMLNSGWLAILSTACPVLGSGTCLPCSNGSSPLRSSNGPLAVLFATLAHRPALPNPGIFHPGGPKARLCLSAHDIRSLLRAKPTPHPPDFGLIVHFLRFFFNPSFGGVTFSFSKVQAEEEQTKK